MSRRACLAVRCNDQEVCGFCGLQWDVDDPDPPACRREALASDIRHAASGDYSEQDLSDHMVRTLNRQRAKEIKHPELDDVMYPPLSHAQRVADDDYGLIRRWSVLVDRLPFRPPPGYHGPRQPGALAPRLIVDGSDVGPLCAPFLDTARGRGEMWEWVARMNVRRA